MGNKGFKSVLDNPLLGFSTLPCLLVKYSDNRITNNQRCLDRPREALALRTAALRWNVLSSTRCHNVAALPPNIARSVIPLPSVRAGLAFSEEADPPLEDTRSVDHLSPGTNGFVIRSGDVVALAPSSPERLAAAWSWSWSCHTIWHLLPVLIDNSNRLSAAEAGESGAVAASGEAWVLPWE
jgi:hypothetical protein